VDVQIKFKEHGKRMSALYAMSCQEAQMIQAEAQKKVENTEQERKAAEQRMKMDFEWKFTEFTTALHTMLPDERRKRSVH
jgi:hypothetical protein